jgi:hypothetical protein
MVKQAGPYYLHLKMAFTTAMKVGFQHRRYLNCILSDKLHMRYLSFAITVCIALFLPHNRVFSQKVTQEESFPHTGTHFYYPGTTVHDTWYLNYRDTIHLFHLPNIQHATSIDCINWETMETIMRDELPYNIESWTGCTVEHDGNIYLYWTSNTLHEKRFLNAISLAVSEDGGKTFEFHPDNPIIKPDARWYLTENDPIPLYDYHAKNNLGLLDWRDIYIIKDSTTGIFHGYITSRMRGKKNEFESACIARVSSKDLVHWETHPPVFSTGRWGCHEVPTVLNLQGKWYLTAMGQHPREGVYPANDSSIKWANVVAVANSPEGPFQLIEDNCLLAGDETSDGYSLRTVEFKGDILAFTCRVTKSEKVNIVLSLPTKLVPRNDGGLLDLYWSGNDKAFGKKHSIKPQSIDGKETLTELPDVGRAYMAKTTIKIEDATAAGISFGNTCDGQGFTLYLNAKEKRVEIVRGDKPGENILWCRNWKIEPDRKYQLRFVFIDNLTTVYVNEQHVVNKYIGETKGGSTAIKSIGGRAQFTDIFFWEPKHVG